MIKFIVSWLFCIGFAFVGILFQSDFRSTGASETPNMAAQIYVLNSQNGIEFWITNRWELDEVVLYVEENETLSLLSRVIYCDKDGQRELTQDLTSPENWSIWQQRYQEVRYELVEKRLLLKLNENNKDHDGVWGSLLTFTKADWSVVITIACVGLMVGIYCTRG